VVGKLDENLGIRDGECERLTFSNISTDVLAFFASEKKSVPAAFKEKNNSLCR
jgi:hypothetical protein